MTTTKLLKPASRKPPRNAKQTPADVAIFEDIDEKVPRSQLMGVLSRSSDPRAETLLNLIQNPLDKIQAKMSLYRLARLADLTWEELVNLIRNDHLLDGILSVAKETPLVMMDTARDARSRTETCIACEGEGQIPVGNKMQVCRACEGRGERYIMGDIENRKIIWQSTGLIDKKSGINTQINIGTAHPSASFESMVHRGRDALEAAAAPAVTVESQDVEK